MEYYVTASKIFKILLVSVVEKVIKFILADKISPEMAQTLIILLMYAIQFFNS